MDPSTGKVLFLSWRFRQLKNERKHKSHATTNRSKSHIKCAYFNKDTTSPLELF